MLIYLKKITTNLQEIIVKSLKITFIYDPSFYLKKTKIKQILLAYKHIRITFANNYSYTQLWHKTNIHIPIITNWMNY